MNKQLFMVIVSLLSLFFLTAQTCTVSWLSEQSCYDDSDCNSGYVCESGVCTTQESSIPDDPIVADDGDDGTSDSDNDGLSDEYETELGTDPHDADTDGDGLTDGDEVNIFDTDPTVADDAETDEVDVTLDLRIQEDEIEAIRTELEWLGDEVDAMTADVTDATTSYGAGTLSEEDYLSLLKSSVDDLRLIAGSALLLKGELQYMTIELSAYAVDSTYINYYDAINVLLSDIETLDANIAALLDLINQQSTDIRTILVDLGIDEYTLLIDAIEDLGWSVGTDTITIEYDVLVANDGPDTSIDSADVICELYVEDQGNLGWYSGQVSAVVAGGLAAGSRDRVICVFDMNEMFINGEVQGWRYTELSATFTATLLSQGISETTTRSSTWDDSTLRDLVSTSTMAAINTKDTDSDGMPDAVEYILGFNKDDASDGEEAMKYALGYGDDFYYVGSSGELVYSYYDTTGFIESQPSADVIGTVSMEYEEGTGSYLDMSSATDVDYLKLYDVDVVHDWLVMKGRFQPVITPRTQWILSILSNVIDCGEAPQYSLSFYNGDYYGLARTKTSFGYVSGGDVVSGEWQEVTAVFTGSMLYLYVDGQFITSVATETGGLYEDVDTELYIGANDPECSSSADFEGYLDYLYVWGE